IKATVAIITSRVVLVVLHSFPTRRSSDLLERHRRFFLIDESIKGQLAMERPKGWNDAEAGDGTDSQGGAGQGDDHRDRPRRVARSEEHTSELQSRENLVCRLLPEKKKGRE